MTFDSSYAGGKRRGCKTMVEWEIQMGREWGDPWKQAKVTEEVVHGIQPCLVICAWTCSLAFECCCSCECSTVSACSLAFRRRLTCGGSALSVSVAIGQSAEN